MLTGVTKGSEDAALDTAAFAAVKNKVLGPVKGTFGYYVFEVTAIKPAKTQSLAAATATITQVLQQTAQTNAQTAVDAQAKKQWQSQTTCRTAYAMADCKGYTPPKTTSTAAPQTSTVAPSTTAPSTTTTTSK